MDKNPAPAAMVNTLLSTRFHTCQVVQDFWTINSITLIISWHPISFLSDAIGTPEPARVPKKRWWQPWDPLMYCLMLQKSSTNTWNLEKSMNNGMFTWHQLAIGCTYFPFLPDFPAQQRSNTDCSMKTYFWASNGVLGWMPSSCFLTLAIPFLIPPLFWVFFVCLF